jgi:hypothetical protein
MIFNHISARVPGRHDHFLINPYGLFYEEVTASNLVKIDLDGKIVGHSDWPINEAGFIIHGAVHAARPDVGCVIHHHSPAVVAVSALECGLLPVEPRGSAVLQPRRVLRLRRHLRRSRRMRADHRRARQGEGALHAQPRRADHGAHYRRGAAPRSESRPGVSRATQRDVDRRAVQADSARVALHTMHQVLDKPERNEPVIVAVMRRLDRLQPEYRL